MCSAVSPLRLLCLPSPLPVSRPDRSTHLAERRAPSGMRALRCGGGLHDSSGDAVRRGCCVIHPSARDCSDRIARLRSRLHPRRAQRWTAKADSCAGLRCAERCSPQLARSLSSLRRTPPPHPAACAAHLSPMAHLRRVADYWSKLAKQQGSGKKAGHKGSGRASSTCEPPVPHPLTPPCLPHPALPVLAVCVFVSYPARSVFKLKELDAKYRLFRDGDRVLDLGCSPGSWTQYAAERVGGRGFVLGLDTQPLPLTLPLPPHVSVLRQDAFRWDPHPSFRGAFDIVLSDMAPSTTGIKSLDVSASHALCTQALDLSLRVLNPSGRGGVLVLKAFQGAGFPELLKRVQKHFVKTNTIKPEATRGESVETFIVAQGRRKGDTEGTGGGKRTKATPAGQQQPPQTPPTSNSGSSSSSAGPSSR